MAILTIIEGVLGKLAADEIKAWLPILSQKILNFAILQLPEEERKRYVEEWEAHLIDVPGELSRFVYSLDQIRAAFKMAGIHRAGSTPSMAHKMKRYLMSRQRNIAYRVNMTMAWVVWLYLSDLAGCKGGDRFTIARHAKYPRLYRFVKLDPEGGECPLWLSCLMTVSIYLQVLNFKWLQSVKRKLIES